MEEKKKSALGNERSSHDLIDKLKMKDSDIKVCVHLLFLLALTLKSFIYFHTLEKKNLMKFIF